MSEDDFTKIKYVGGGSFGRVYKAKRKRDKKICALKYISKSKSRKAVQDARNEIYIIERLRHTNIIELFQHFETDQHIVIVCEYVSKELFRAMKEERKLKFSEEKVRQFSCQICSAIYYIHSQKVLHRDLKPENILLTKQGTIKVCDFGFACFMGESYYARTIQGTLPYMAPELFGKSSQVHYAEKVDLWAIGCIIYELFTGRAAFDSRSLREMCKMHKNLQLPNEMNEDMKHLVKKLLTFDHHRRIPWPYILKHPFFNGGIKVNKEDLERESPYTQPEVAAQKVKDHNMKVRLIRRHERHHTRKIPQRVTKVETIAKADDTKPTEKKADSGYDNLDMPLSNVEDNRRPYVSRARSLYDNVNVDDAGVDMFDAAGVDVVDAAAVDSGVVVADDDGDWDDGDVAGYWTNLGVELVVGEDQVDAGLTGGAGEEEEEEEEEGGGGGGGDTIIVYIEEGDAYEDSDDERNSDS